MGSRSLTPADLDPVDAAASEIAPDPMAGGTPEQRMVARLVRAGMTPDEAAKSVAGFVRRNGQPDSSYVDSVDNPSSNAALAERVRGLRQTQASQQRFEDDYNAAVGPTSLAPPLPERAGRFEFRPKAGGGVEAVDTAPGEAESRAEFAKWASASPGSARQAQYDPQAFAAWEQAQADKRQAQYANERETYGVADGPGWANRLTPEQASARQARADSDARQANSNRDVRQAIFEARSLARNQPSEDELTRRAAVVRRAQARGNPLEYLGRTDVGDWQKMVASQALLAGRTPDTTPLSVQAKGSELEEKLALMRADAEARATEGREARLSARDESDAARAQAREEAALARQQAMDLYERKAAEDRAARDQQFQQFQIQMQQQSEAAARAAEEARLRHEAAMQASRDQHAAAIKGIEAQMANTGTSASAQVDAARIAADARQAGMKEESDRQSQLLELKQKEAQKAALVGQYGPGVEHLISGDDTPAAQDSLRAIAAEADKGWWGFWKEDAERMDAVLRRIGVTDPARRQTLVQNYGLNLEDNGRGRGSPLSIWFHGKPNYTPAPNP